MLVKHIHTPVVINVCVWPLASELLSSVSRESYIWGHFGGHQSWNRLLQIDLTKKFYRMTNWPR